MIILPDRNIPRSRILLPVHSREWREPSIHQPRNELGHGPTEWFWTVKAVLSDGHVRWAGRFYDREAADAFLFAAVSGSLNYERALWDLPTPAYCPDHGEGATFLIAVTVAITATNATFLRPGDWNDTSNTVWAIGGGGSGARSTGGSTGRASGGGGGEIRIVTNYVPAASSSVTVGANRTGPSSTTNSITNGNAGNATSVTGSGATTITANGGGGGLSSSTATVAGGAGGTGGAAGTGFAGGAGGSSANTRAAAGGGGAGGTTAVGATAPTNSTKTSATAGAAGGATSGGSAGTATTAANGTGGTGGDGTGILSTYGAGGGGGSCYAATGTSTGGSGGNYGGGGGSAICSATGVASTGGTGKQGIVVMDYTPRTLAGNLAMMGM